MNTDYKELETKQQKLILDFNQKTIKTVIAKQYDKCSRFIPIQCTNNGESFKLNPSFCAYVKVLTPDNRALLNPVPIQEDGSILLELTESMLSYPGKAKAEIRITDTNNGKLLSTMNFHLIIEASVYDDERVLASDDFHALTELMEKASADYSYVIEVSQASADEAKKSEENAKISEENASTYAADANMNAIHAADSAVIATQKATAASDSESAAAAKATEAANSATMARSYTQGDTATRENETIDCAKYYYQQTKSISESLSGALKPIGTVSFSNLPALSAVTEGDMYNISDQFTTTADFKEGAGNEIPAGSNIYKTADGMWDVLAGSPVTGVKGNAEDTYRKGNINITPEDIGAVNKAGDIMTGNLILGEPGTYLAGELPNNTSHDHALLIGHENQDYWNFYERGGTYNFYKSCSGTDTLLGTINENGWEGNVKGDLNGNASSATKAIQDENGNSIVDTYLTKTENTADNTITFTSTDNMNPAQWADVALITSGEKHLSLFNKISTMFKNIRYLYKMLGTTDISGLGNGTVTGALSALNTNTKNIPDILCGTVAVETEANSLVGFTATFPKSISSYPVVICTPYHGAHNNATVKIVSKSLTGFTGTILANASATFIINWIAVSSKLPY